jgi:hypothetical protein
MANILGNWMPVRDGAGNSITFPTNLRPQLGLLPETNKNTVYWSNSAPITFTASQPGTVWIDSSSAFNNIKFGSGDSFSFNSPSITMSLA